MGYRLDLQVSDKPATAEAVQSLDERLSELGFKERHDDTSFDSLGGTATLYPENVTQPGAVIATVELPSQSLPARIQEVVLALLEIGAEWSFDLFEVQADIRIPYLNLTDVITYLTYTSHQLERANDQLELQLSAIQEKGVVSEENKALPKEVMHTSHTMSVTEVVAIRRICAKSLQTVLSTHEPAAVDTAFRFAKVFFKAVCEFLKYARLARAQVRMRKREMTAEADVTALAQLVFIRCQEMSVVVKKLVDDISLDIQSATNTVYTVDGRTFGSPLKAMVGVSRDYLDRCSDVIVEDTQRRMKIPALKRLEDDPPDCDTCVATGVTADTLARIADNVDLPKPESIEYLWVSCQNQEMRITRLAQDKIAKRGRTAAGTKSRRNNSIEQEQLDPEDIEKCDPAKVAVFLDPREERPGQYLLWIVYSRQARALADGNAIVFGWAAFKRLKEKERDLPLQVFYPGIGPSLPNSAPSQDRFRSWKNRVSKARYEVNAVLKMLGLPLITRLQKRPQMRENWIPEEAQDTYSFPDKFPVVQCVTTSQKFLAENPECSDAGRLDHLVRKIFSK